MVLQHDESVRFWGETRPNAVVTLLLGEVSVTTGADDLGFWELYLPKQEAGGPHTITIDSRETLTFEDVYFGDVWIAGGQSNMEWQIGANIDNMEAELNDTDYPQIRFIKVAHDISVSPLTDFTHDTEWKIANKENARNFSAVAWFYAKHNHKEKNVPVGIIDNNWGGTPVESWIPAERLLELETTRETAEEMLNSDKNWDQIFEENDRANDEKYTRVTDTTNFLSYGVHLPSYDDAGWEIVTLPNSEPLYDFVWLRKSFNISNPDNATLSFGNPGKFTIAFINGQKVYQKAWSEDSRLIEIDASVLREGENQIAIRTVEDWDNRSFIGKENEFWIRVGDEQISLEGDWRFSNRIEPPMPEVIRYEHWPGTLFNSMINPVAGYTIKGAIWYQGESNVGRYMHYHELFTVMIEEWRSAWNQGPFPFLFVQLANFLQHQESPQDSYWAGLREAQANTLKLRNTGMATIIDIGDAEDIHPRNKQDVGYRLWQSARHVAYHEDNVHSGPTYRGHIVDGNRMIVTFNHVGSGLVNKKSEGGLPGFAIAGSDSVFHWAEATVDGDMIFLESDSVANPVVIRYAWADNPETALYNLDGLPAVPFRTDDW